MKSKVWMITGASRGLGLHLARAALAAGHRVVAAARRPGQLHEALHGFGERLLPLPLDVTHGPQAEMVAARAQERFGRIDVLVNNAGYGLLGWFENLTEQQIRQQFDTNVFGSMNVTRAVLPLMRAQRSGHVFSISSAAALVSVAGGSIYSASKSALEGWMEGLAEELKPLGIAATIVEPGLFRTDFLDATSVAYGRNDISDYAEPFAKFKARHEQMNHEQVGDPAKFAAALLQLADLPDPPVRFAAGSDAHTLLMKKLERMHAEVERWAALSRSTDGAA
jgi:NAD(P)-dependent dehydrogenase (short-subunit alcohol dehydrogenase family)